VRSRQDERGAAAVEFTLVLPVLLMMVLGIAEFGRAYYVQASVSQAAREGVRVMALQNNSAASVAATEAAATPLTLTNVGVSPSTCATSGTTLRGGHRVGRQHRPDGDGAGAHRVSPLGRTRR
jgi:Flp pilus assembly protein TadG